MLFSGFFRCSSASMLLLLRAPLPFLVFCFLNFLDRLGLTSSTKSSFISHNILACTGLHLLNSLEHLHLYHSVDLYTLGSLFAARQSYLPNYIGGPSLQRIYVRYFVSLISQYLTQKWEYSVQIHRFLTFRPRIGLIQLHHRIYRFVYMLHTCTLYFYVRYKTCQN